MRKPLLLTPKVCPGCEQDFVPKDHRQKFCAPRCKDAFYRTRNRRLQQLGLEAI